MANKKYKDYLKKLERRRVLPTFSIYSEFMKLQGLMEACDTLGLNEDYYVYEKCLNHIDSLATNLIKKPYPICLN